MVKQKYDPNKSLKEHVLEESVKPQPQSFPRRQGRSRVAYAPKKYNSRQITTFGELVPISLQLDSATDSFLWDSENTNYEDPYMFSLDLIEERYPKIMKQDLFKKAAQVSQIILDQTNRHHKVCTGENLVSFELKIGNITENVIWDLGNPQNSPAGFAYVLCQDLGLPTTMSIKLAQMLTAKINEHSQESPKRLETLTKMPQFPLTSKTLPPPNFNFPL